MSEPATQRIIPGAPPPASLSKGSGKKKRKAGGGGTQSASKAPDSPSNTPSAIPDATAAALVEKAPDAKDIKEGALAPELVADPAPSRGATPAPTGTTPAPADEPKRSPVYELVNKRQKILGKKITRFQSYAVQEQSKLNDDQIRSLKTLPTLEAVFKELDDVKKAIHDYDLEQAGSIAAEKAERDAIEAQKIADAVAAAQAGHVSKVLDLLTLIRLQSMLAAGHPQVVALGLNESEATAIYGAGEALVGEGGHREHIVNGFINGEGDFQGVPYLRLQEIVRTFLNPPPAIDEPAVEATNGANGTSYLAPDPAVVISRAPSAGPTTTSFHFINASELDDDQEVAQDEPVIEETEITVIEDETGLTVTDVVTVTEVAPGVEVVEETLTVEAEPQQLDWADPEHDELPPLDNVQASFGMETTSVEEAASLPVEGAEPATPGVDADGFSAARGRGYRGQRRGNNDGPRGGRGMRGGYRGGRGGFRGGERGGHEGGGFRSDFMSGGEGDRGGYRGGEGDRGGYRGGEGDRGGYRGRGRGFRGDGEGRGYYRGGGDRGGARGGRSDGDWRSGGDNRGRGRGRGGRGGFAEGQAGAPPTPQAA